MLVSYLVNRSPFYLIMAGTSISMLRRYNRKIPVRIFFVDEGGEDDYSKLFLELCSRLDVQVVRVPPVQIAGTHEALFHINKAHWTTQSEESLLCLDADTFVFGDIEALFEAHQECDVYASENRAIYTKGVWKRSYFSGVTPLNSGVVLWNHGKIRCWDFDRFVPLLNEGRIPESELIRSLGKPATIEEFALSLSVARSRLSYRTFNLSFANTSLYFDTDQPMQTLVFHCYSHVWLHAYRKIARLAGLAPFRSMTSFLEELIAG